MGRSVFRPNATFASPGPPRDCAASRVLLCAVTRSSCQRWQSWQLRGLCTVLLPSCLIRLTCMLLAECHSEWSTTEASCRHHFDRVRRQHGGKRRDGGREEAGALPQPQEARGGGYVCQQRARELLRLPRARESKQIAACLSSAPVQETQAQQLTGSGFTAQAPMSGRRANVRRGGPVPQKFLAHACCGKLASPTANMVVSFTPESNFRCPLPSTRTPSTRAAIAARPEISPRTVFLFARTKLAGSHAFACQQIKVYARAAHFRRPAFPRTRRRFFLPSSRIFSFLRWLTFSFTQTLSLPLSCLFSSCVCL